MPKSNEMVECRVLVEHTTANAIKCIKEDDRMEEDPSEFWLPLSQIEITYIDHKEDLYTVLVPEWLAIEKGLV